MRSCSVRVNEARSMSVLVSAPTSSGQVGVWKGGASGCRNLRFQERSPTASLCCGYGLGVVTKNNKKDEDRRRIIIIISKVKRVQVILNQGEGENGKNGERERGKSQSQ